MRLACLTEAAEESDDVTMEKNEKNENNENKEAATETTEEPKTDEQPKESEDNSTSQTVVRLTDDQLEAVVQRVTGRVTEALAATAASSTKPGSSEDEEETVEFEDEDALLYEITSAAVEAVAGDADTG
jgi:hypothetical protein